jgi:hypothetical protein
MNGLRLHRRIPIDDPIVHPLLPKGWRVIGTKLKGSNFRLSNPTWWKIVGVSIHTDIHVYTHIIYIYIYICGCNCPFCLLKSTFDLSTVFAPFRLWKSLRNYCSLIKVSFCSQWNIA